MPKLYIDNFVGITNRLEVLPLAFAIQQKYGHKIILNWAELDDAIDIDGVHKGRVFIEARINGLRVRDCDQAIFDSLGDKKIILRSLDGPDDILSPIYMEIPKKIRLKEQLKASVVRAFADHGDHPVVGVHIRHGDFRLMDQKVFDAKSVEWPAVPVWWFERNMARIVKVNPNVRFFLSSTGDPEQYSVLYKNFDIFNLDEPTVYKKKNLGNQSRYHPVADMFALACCQVGLGSPVSGFSHWAFNVLGNEKRVFIAKTGARVDDPKIIETDMFGRRLPFYRHVSRESEHEADVSDRFEEMFAEIGPPCLDWLDNPSSLSGMRRSEG